MQKYPIAIILVILSNLLMFKTFTMALSRTSTIKATVLNSASNIISTGLIGNLLGEQVELKWWFGALLMVSGTLILNNKEKKD